MGRKLRELTIKDDFSVGVQGEIRLKPRNFGDFQRYPQFRGDSGTDQREDYFCIGAGNIDGLGKNSSSIGIYGRVRKENF